MQLGDIRNKLQTGAKIANTAKDVKENGIKEAAKKEVKKQAKKKAKQAAKKAAKKAGKAAKKAGGTAAKWLLTTPPGWCVGLLFLAGGTGLIKMADVNNNTNNSARDNQYIATLEGGCATSSSPSASGSFDLGNGTSGNYSLKTVAKFATSPITSTWGVSISKAESLFLAKNRAVANRYGLSKSNISKVSNVVRAEGVSPVFFYMYAVNEGGGAGGFINHYQTSSGDAIKDAKADADYLKETASSTAFPPATETSSKAAITDTSYAKKVLDKMPEGSIGRVYIPATAAVTAEIAYLSGVHAGWTTAYGHPLSACIDYIKQLGGDPSKADTISVDAASDKCGDSDSGDTGLTDGGMTLEAARKFMDKFYKTPLSAADYLGAAPGTPDVHDNCTVFSAWFLNKHTSLHSVSGNGMDIAGNLAKSNSKLKLSYTPKAYSIFSIKPFGGGQGMGVGDVGHTGVILGVDKKRGKVIIGQGEYGHAFITSSDWNSGANAQEIPLSQVTKANGWSFVDVTDYVKDVKK